MLPNGCGACSCCEQDGVGEIKFYACHKPTWPEAEAPPYKEQPVIRVQKALGGPAHGMSKAPESNEPAARPPIVEQMHTPSFDDASREHTMTPIEKIETLGQLVEDVPMQCGCFPLSENKPPEAHVLMRDTWCCYCCCIGIGWNSKMEPLVGNCDCASCHASCEAANVYVATEGVCGEFLTCCCASFLCQLPPQDGTPHCILCNEYCCGKYGVKKTELERERPDIRRSISAMGELAYVMQTRFVPCWCWLCGCSEALGGADLCGQNSKCACCKYSIRCGLPFTGCVVLSFCFGSFLHCRGPTCVSEQPVMYCCGKEVECSVPTRCPKCCESLPCNTICACSALRDCFVYNREQRQEQRRRTSTSSEGQGRLSQTSQM